MLEYRDGSLAVSTRLDDVGIGVRALVGDGWGYGATNLLTDASVASSAGPCRNRPTPGDAVPLAAVIEHAPRLGIDPTSRASACLAGTRPLAGPTTDTR